MRRNNDALPESIESADAILNELDCVASDMRDLAEQVGEHHADLARELAGASGGLEDIAGRVRAAARELERRECGISDEGE